MIPYVFRVIVFQYKAKHDNSELGIFTSKHDSMCHKISELSFFCVGPKTITQNSSENESEISEFSENSELSLWPKSLGGIGFTLSYPGFLIHAGAIFCNFVAMATAQNLTNWLNFAT